MTDRAGEQPIRQLFTIVPKTLRYDEGYTSYLEVLDADRSLFNVELAHTTGQNVLFRSLINIYKSMGGGWVDQAEQGMPAQPVMEAGFIP
jgi:multidrug efflux system outer membrane protein